MTMRIPFNQVIQRLVDVLESLGTNSFHQFDIRLPCRHTVAYFLIMRFLPKHYTGDVHFNVNVRPEQARNNLSPHETCVTTGTS